MPSPPFDAVSRGAASCIFEIALLVHSDADDIREFVLKTVGLWSELDKETLHPPARDQAHAA